MKHNKNCKYKYCKGGCASMADGGVVKPEAAPVAPVAPAAVVNPPAPPTAKTDNMPAAPKDNTAGVASPTHTSTETGGSSPGGASTGGVGSGIGGAGTGGAATGGASTGGAGTVTLTISGDSGGKGKKGSSKAPTTINISNVGGKTDAGNVASGDGPGSSGTGGKGDGSGGGGGGAAPSEPEGMSPDNKPKKMANGGTPASEPMLMKLREFLAKRGAPISRDVDEVADASTVDASSSTPKNYAKGGTPPGVTFMEDETPEQVKKTVHLGMADGGIAEQVDAQMKPKDAIGLPGVPDPNAKPMNPQVAAGLPGVPALPGVPPQVMSAVMAAKKAQPPTPMYKGGIDISPEGASMGPTSEEKMEFIKKNMKKEPLKLADGGVVDPTQLPADAPQDSKLQAILKAIGSTMGNALPTGASLAAPVAAATNAVAPLVPGAVNAMGNVAGAMVGKDFPQMADASVAPAAAAPTPPPAAPSSLPAQNVAPQATNAPQSKPAPTSTDFANLFNQDPSKIAAGLNPADRQNEAKDVWNQTHTVGSMIAQAMAGIGDALAAKGGVNQDMLGKVIANQTANRAEMMGNFDKARDAAVQNFTMKTQMGKNAIDMLAAKDAYGPASPALIKTLHGMGIEVPAGALNKDLPQYFQAAQIQAGQSIAQGKMQLDATKQAADEVDQIAQHPGALHMQMGPAQKEAMIKSRASDLMAKANGMVRIMTSDGQHSYIPQQNLAKAKQMDPGLMVQP